VLEVRAHQIRDVLLYAERYPHAGGAHHYAACLESEAGFKLELVAEDGV
jgi:hypothetical protein